MKNLMNRTGAICGILACLLAAVTANAAVTLPFADNFNSGSLAAGWTESDPENIEVVGGQATVSNASLTMNIAGTHSNVWYRVLAAPVQGTDDPDVANVTGAFYVSNGWLRVYGTNGWESVKSIGSGWKGFAVHVDYTNKTWDIYTTDASSWSNMTRANPTPIPFPAAGYSNQATSFTVESGDKASIDNAAASVGSGEPGTYAKVALRDFAAGENGYFTFPIFNYGSSALDNTLAGRLGRDLRTGMVRSPGASVVDRIHVLSTNYWNKYKLNAAGAWVPDGQYQDPTSLQINLSTVLRVERTGAASCGFFPYNNDSTLVAVSGKHTEDALGGTVVIVLSPPDEVSNPQGLTALTWPSSDKKVNELGLGANYVANGDWLYQAVSGGFKSWPWINNAWQRSGSPAVDVVPEGAVLWVKRLSGTSPTNFTVTVQ